MSDSTFDYFDQAYRTGSDVWSHVPYPIVVSHMLPDLPDDALVLELGAGRGTLVQKLIAKNYRVLAVDYVKSIVDKGNADLKLMHQADRARFVVGDATDIPFTDSSFDAVVSIGLLQHMSRDQWGRVVSDIHRVLKPGGTLLVGNLSKETPRYYDWRPQLSETQQFEKFGLHYYFFTDTEIRDLFEAGGFTFIKSHTETFDSKTDPDDRIAMNFSLFRK